MVQSPPFLLTKLTRNLYGTVGGIPIEGAEVAVSSGLWCLMGGPKGPSSTQDNNREHCFREQQLNMFAGAPYKLSELQKLASE